MIPKHYTDYTDQFDTEHVQNAQRLLITYK